MPKDKQQGAASGPAPAAEPGPLELRFEAAIEASPERVRVAGRSNLPAGFCFEAWVRSFSSIGKLWILTPPHAVSLDAEGGFHLELRAEARQPFSPAPYLFYVVANAASQPREIQAWLGSRFERLKSEGVSPGRFLWIKAFVVP